MIVAVLDSLSVDQQAMFLAASVPGIELAFAAPEKAFSHPHTDVLLTRRAAVSKTVCAKFPGSRYVQVIGRFPWMVESESHVPVRTWPLLSRITVAEHALALMLSLLRHVPQGDLGVRRGDYQKRNLKPKRTSETEIAWNWLGLEMTGLYDKTLGLIGAGEIALEVAERAKAFGMHVLYWSRSRLPRAFESSFGLTWCDTAQDIAASSDIVSLHVPHTPQTEHLVSEAFISRMKVGAVLINTARGGLIEEQALAKALWNGRLKAAALDVFAVEPLPIGSPLLTAPNLLLSPHTGGGVAGGLPLDLTRLFCSLAEDGTDNG